MDTKLIKVKEEKVEDKIDFYTAFGYVLISQENEENGKVALTFERDKENLEGDYGKVRRGEGLYNRIARPYPLGAIIALGIGAILLALFFVLQKIFIFYIVFLYASLTFFGFAIYLLIIWLVILVKRNGLLKRVVRNVALEAGTLRDLPLKNNIKEESEETWLIAEKF